MEEKIDIAKVKETIVAKANEEGEKLEEKDIQYVKKMVLLKNENNFCGIEENDLFVVEKEQGEDENKIICYEIYNKDGLLIAKSDEKGNIEFTEEFKKMLEREGFKGNNFGLDKRNLNVKDIEEQMEEIKKDGKTQEIEDKERSLEDKKTETKSEEKQEKNDETTEKTKPEEIQEKMEEGLGLDKKDIKSSSEIKDPEFYKLVPEAKEYNGNVSIVYVGSTNEFMIVGEDKKTGQYMPLKTVEASRGVQAGETNKTIDMERDGRDIKQGNLKAVLHIKGDKEFAFSAKLEGMNPIEFQELRYDRSTGVPVARNMQTTHQYPTTKEVDKITNKDKNINMANEVEQYKKREEMGDKEITVDEIEDKTPEQEEEQSKKDKEDELETNSEGEENTIEDEGRGARDDSYYNSESHRPPILN